jgi:hypothetical protein
MSNISAWDLRCVVRVKVSEEHTASIFRVEELTTQAGSKQSKLSAEKCGIDIGW